MRSTLAAATLTLGLVSLPPMTHAQPEQAPKLVGMTPVGTLVPTTGFIDDPFGFDGAGGRLVYITADAGYMAELAVIDLNQGAVVLQRIDISKFTTTPIFVAFVEGGFFVVSRSSDTDKAKAAVIDGRGKVVRTFGPATDIALIQRDGRAAVSLYDKTEKTTRKRGKSAAQVEHKVELVALDTGKPFGQKRTLLADDQGVVAKLEFRINHWERGYTRAVGIEGGTWDAKENQRSPDHEAWYDMVTGTFEKREDIADVIAHAHLMRSRAAHPNQQDFLEVTEDLSALHLVSGGQRRPIELAEPFGHYDPRSLVYQPSDDGLFLFTMKIDPVNKEAVARKRADPEYLDLYVHRAGEPKATRLARYLLDDKKKRNVSWRATEEYWILVPRLIGFSRGGKELAIYKLARP